MPDGDAIHRHRGTRAIQRLVEFAPSTGGLALWVRHEDVADGPLIATDGTTIRYGTGFEALAIDLQAGLVAHEVLHIALRHAHRYVGQQHLRGDVDLRLFNICADAIVNSTLGHLGWLRLPAGSVFVEQLLVRALDIRVGVDQALLAWDVESLYRAIDDRRFAQGGRRGAGSSHGAANDGRDGAGGGAELRDGTKAAAARSLGAAVVFDLMPAPDSQTAPEREADQTRMWNERLLRAHASDGDFSLLRVLIADLPQIRTPWEQVLRTQLARALSHRPALSWSRPTRSYIANQGRAGPRRRMPWEPGFGGPQSVPRLAVIVDVSGSIDDDLMGRFATEIEAITRRLEAGLVIVIGDDRVRRVTRFEPGRSDLRDIAFDGGGRTDFTPLLEEADRHRPDLAIVLTDLDGLAGYKPACPVLWAVPESHRDAMQPFGRLLVLR
ncbi:MAG: VWA-like domain-containing protein [Burkholderiaceae bacterium]